MIARVFRHQHDAVDPRGGVGVLLEARIPEILGEVLLTGSEARRGCLGIAGERQREPDLDWCSVRPPALPLEAQGIGQADTAGAKRGRVGERIRALQDQQR